MPRFGAQRLSAEIDDHAIDGKLSTSHVHSIQPSAEWQASTF
jgi:hypothetical protein